VLFRQTRRVYSILDHFVFFSFQRATRAIANEGTTASRADLCSAENRVAASGKSESAARVARVSPACCRLKRGETREISPHPARDSARSIDVARSIGCSLPGDVARISSRVILLPSSLFLLSSDERKRSSSAYGSARGDYRSPNRSRRCLFDALRSVPRLAPKLVSQSLKLPAYWRTRAGAPV
jgi:hypothetical protein